MKIEKARSEIFRNSEEEIINFFDRQAEMIIKMIE
jgi:hypothetical protein